MTIEHSAINSIIISDVAEMVKSIIYCVPFSEFVTIIKMPICYSMIISEALSYGTLEICNNNDQQLYRTL